MLAALLRMPGLGWPRAIVFDETYYAKDAYSLLQFGNERSFVQDANERLLNGNLDVFSGGAAYVVHPPLGKWMIAAGEWVFGVNPFGWRISAAMIGIAMVVLVHRISLRIFTNTVIALLAGLFMAIDGLAIVLSRTALLDQFLTFWILVTLYALVRDRDHFRHTLALVAYGEPVPTTRWLRPWRIVAIITIALAFGTKWSALWFGFGFGLLALLWDKEERRSHPDADTRSWLKDTGWIVGASIIGAATYALTWIGWFLAANAYGRKPNTNVFMSWIEYHRSALAFHTGLTADHPYKASPYFWPLQVRPTSFWFETYSNGRQGCTAPSCSAEVVALGNPLLWWGASLAVVVLVVLFVGNIGKRIDWWALSAPAIGIAAGWLPWLYFHNRTTFTFYSIVYAPFMFMVLAYALHMFVTKQVVVDGEEFSVTVDEFDRRRNIATTVFVTLAVVLSLFFLPVWVGTVQPTDAWQLRMWFPGWI